MICADCSELAFHLNTSIRTIRSKGRIPGSTLWVDWKTIEQLLQVDAYKNCDLCKAYVSITRVERLNSHTHKKQPIRVETYSKGDTDKGDCYVIYRARFHVIRFSDIPAVIFQLWREQISSSDLSYYENRQKIETPLSGHRKVVQRLTSKRSLAQAAPKSQPYEGVSWEKPIMDVRGPETAAQVRFWLWKCVNDHPKCRVALSGERFGMYPQTSSLDQCKLPSRILDVGSTDSLCVRLVETTTEIPSASYVALSHCWGPPDKQPLRTTLDTLEDYIQSGIPLDCLPQTFSDAVWVTRELGIRYLWIDSLCIIQDSRSDWEAESERMGAIYEGATLTLGAAHARDSSEGLFKGLQRPDPEKVVKVYTPIEGSGYSALAPYVTCFLPNLSFQHTDTPWYGSPLAKRAWVMQEWSLSRRFVWCEDKSLYWKCQEETKAEPFVDASLSDIPSFNMLTSNWHRFIEDYVWMQLTYETDRLIALRGIVTALKYSYRKEQEYHFGIWLEGHKTLFSLLWEITDLYDDPPLESSLQEMPSWSWASVSGKKIFLLEEKMDTWNTSYTWIRDTQYYYDDRGITAENKGTELHLRSRIGVVQLCLQEYYDRHRRKMSIYITDSSPESTGSEGTAGKMGIGNMTLDHAIEVHNFPTPSGITHHIIPLVRQHYFNGINTDYMLVVEPANKPDGSKAYRRVGVGYVEQKWPKKLNDRWGKILSEMKTEDIVLV